MDQQMVLDIGKEAILVAVKIAAPALLASMIMGLLISILQAATQINEQTLSFIPKILAMSAAIIVSGSWAMQTIVFFTKEIFRNISKITQ